MFSFTLGLKLKSCVYPEELRYLSILYLDPSKVDLMCGSPFVLQCKIAPGCGPAGQSSCFLSGVCIAFFEQQAETEQEND